MDRPVGIAAIAGIFLLAAAYLFILGLIMLFSPGSLSMRLGAPVLLGLELAGPYMFLIVGTVNGLIGVGLWRLHKWARWAAILVATIGVVMLLPIVSAAAVDFGIALLLTGFGMIVRVIIIWYLFQEPVAEAFSH
jgi:hypothetical protein